MNMTKWILGSAALTGLVACGDGADVASSAFDANFLELSTQSQVVALIDGTSTGATADFATLTAQGAATYEGPVAINFDDTTLVSESITGTTTLNDPDLLGRANIRTAFDDEGATLDGDFTSFTGSDGTEYAGTLALAEGRINSSFDGSGGTVGSAIVRGTLTGDGDGDGVYQAGVRGEISEDGSEILLRGSNVDGEAGRDFIFTAAGALVTEE